VIFYWTKLILTGNGKITGPGTATIGGNRRAIFDWQGGTLSGTGAVKIVKQSVILLAEKNPAELTLDQRQINNYGGFNFHSATLKMQNGSVINNYNSFVVFNDVGNIKNPDKRSKIVNTGLLLKGGGTNENDLDVDLFTSNKLDLLSAA